VRTILCIFTVLVLTASTADAYVRRHPVARGAAVAAGTAAVAAHPWGYDVYGPGGSYGPGRPVAAAPGWGGGAHPAGYSVYGPGGSYAPTAVQPVGAGWSGGAHPWGYSVYGPGGSYAPTAVQPVGAGWSGGAHPAGYDVYGPGGNYADAPGTCYKDCDNYRKALRESGYDPKNYRTKAGTVKQTAY
jgi:hypothetical protein